MDALHLSIAVLPLAAYLALVAVLNMRRRPVILNGYRDSAAMAMGISGLMAAGPLELFLPERAAFQFGPVVWVLLLALYALTVSLIILSMRPRLVVYNATLEELRPVLNSVAQAADPQSKWAGDALTIPALGVQLHLDRTHSFRNVQLVASGGDQSFLGWARLERDLQMALKDCQTRQVGHGVGFLMASITLLIFVSMSVLSQRDTIAAALQEFLRM